MFEVVGLDSFEAQESDSVLSVPVTEGRYGTALPNLKWGSYLE